jgi:hypothetical protein
MERAPPSASDAIAANAQLDTKRHVAVLYVLREFKENGGLVQSAAVESGKQRERRSI